MIKIEDLKPGDVIVSRKAVEPWQLVNRFFNWRVEVYSKRVFGPKCVFPEANHVRTVVGKDGDLLWGFHWTYPTARFCRIQPWMLDPDYAMAFRYSLRSTTTHDSTALSLKYEGDAYDVGELLDMDFSFKRFFDFGKNHYVCSSGAYMLQQKLMGVETPIPTSKAPPCLFANYPNLYYHLNPRIPGKGSKHLSAPLLAEPV